MKKTIYSVLACCMAFVLITSCGGNKTEREVPKGMQLVDLSKYGKPFTFLAPDTATAKGILTITEQNYMLEVRDGKAFGLVFEEGEGNMEQLKTDLQGDEVNKFKSWILEEPNLVAWTSEITKPESHLYGIITVGTSKYVVKDLNSTENEPFTEDQIKKMIDAVKSILEKPKEN